jgi:hypothetical protein
MLVADKGFHNCIVTEFCTKVVVGRTMLCPGESVNLKSQFVVTGLKVPDKKGNDKLRTAIQ